MDFIFYIQLILLSVNSVNGEFGKIGSFVRHLLDQISESDSSSITTLTILSIDNLDDSKYKYVEDDIVHDIVTKVQPDYSVSYPPIMVYPDRFELTNRLGSLNILISDLWEKKDLNLIPLNEFDGFCALIPKERPIPFYEFIFYPFEKEVWYVLAVTFGIGIVVWIISKRVNPNASVGSFLFKLYGYFLGQGSSESSYLLSQKLILQLFIFAFLILGTCYQSLLVALILEPKYLYELKTFDEVKASNLTFAADGKFIDNYLMFDHDFMPNKVVPFGTTGIVPNSLNTPEVWSLQYGIIFKCSMAEVFLKSNANFNDDGSTRYYQVAEKIVTTIEAYPSMNGQFGKIGSFVRNLLDQISEEDPSSITSLTILRIDNFDDLKYKYVEDDIVHDIVAKVQPDYSVSYPPIMVYSDRVESIHRLGSLTLLISDLWENKLMLAKLLFICMSSKLLSINSKIVLISPYPLSAEILSEMILSLNTIQFTNFIFAWEEAEILHIYGVPLFITTNAIKLDPFEKNLNYFYPDKLKDLSKYPMKIAVYDQYPRYQYSKKMFFGLDVPFVRTVVNKLNATFKFYRQQDSLAHDLKHKIANRFYDMCSLLVALILDPRYSYELKTFDEVKTSNLTFAADRKFIENYLMIDDEFMPNKIVPFGITYNQSNSLNITEVWSLQYGIIFKCSMAEVFLTSNANFNGDGSTRYYQVAEKVVTAMDAYPSSLFNPFEEKLKFIITIEASSIRLFISRVMCQNISIFPHR
ncbi:unnamed protein product [Diamesa hyperborea]